MKKIVLVLLFLPFIVTAQQISGAEQCAVNKQNYLTRSNAQVRVAYPGDASIDVHYYKIALNIDVSNKRIVGASTVSFTAAQSLNTFFLDLKSSFTLDSVKSGSRLLKFTHSNDRLLIELPQTVAAKERSSVTVFYQGKPPSNNFGSFEFGTHGPDNFPVVWSLSEPYGAPDWWACKDNQNDKADSSDVWVTMPKAFTSVSNGILEAIVDNGNVRTYKWKNRNPIAHYLISVASTNYARYDNYFKYSAKDSMLVSHYVYPETLTPAVKVQLDETVRALQVFSDVYGLYPFIKEKYGHAQCGFGGGMEHQTCSSMGAFNKGLVAHELAHQWFGDKVTCATWADIWVNEGFATFSEALYAEVTGGEAAYNAEINENFRLAKEATGSIFIQNTASVNEIFNFRRSYAKGASVIHMLRAILGDGVFFKTLRAYLKQYGNSVATIRDFQSVAEATSGKKLSYFFDEWLFGTGYPAYSFGWKKTGNNAVEVLVRQVPKGGNQRFTMPVQLKLTLANKRDTTVVITVDKLEETFSLVGFTAEVTDVTFDPNNYILKDLSEIFLVTASEPTVNDGVTIYPNPASDLLTVNGTKITPQNTQLFSATGQPFTPTIDNGQLDISQLFPGKYWLVINADSEDNKIVKGFVKR